MINVLHITPFYGSDKIGGTERFVTNIIKEQKKLPNINVKVLSTKEISSNPSKSIKEIEIIRYTNFKTIAGFNPFTIINPFNKIFNWADVIHVHSPLYFISMQVIPLAKLMKKKIILHIHGGLGKPPTIVNGFLSRFKPIFDLTMIKFQMNLADVIFTVNKYDILYIDKILKVPIKKVKLLNNGINISDFSTSINRKINGGIINILYVGDLEKWKSVDDLINAVSSLEPKIKAKIKLDLVGSGKEYLNLVNLSKTENVNIKFHGNQPHSKIPKFMEESNLFVHTGLWEGMPTTLLEASAIKLPIISSSAGHSSEFVGNNTRGLLYKPGNIKELAEKIEWSIHNYELMLEKASLAHKKVVSEFMIENISKKIANEYLKLMK